MSILVLALAAVAILFWLAYLIGTWFPRTSAYLLGPGLSLFAVVWLVVLRRDIFGPSHQDVAIPGNFAPLIFGVPLVAMAIAGVVLLVTGLARIQRDDETSETSRRLRRDTQDFSRFRPRESGWLTPRKFCVLVAGAELLIVLALLAF